MGESGAAMLTADFAILSYAGGHVHTIDATRQPAGHGRYALPARVAAL